MEAALCPDHVKAVGRLLLCDLVRDFFHFFLELIHQVLALALVKLSPCGRECVHHGIEFLGCIHMYLYSLLLHQVKILLVVRPRVRDTQCSLLINSLLKDFTVFGG